MKIHLLILLSAYLFVTQNYLYGQEKLNLNWGHVTAADFMLPQSPALSGHENAVIIADVGSIQFVGNKEEWFNWELARKVRIRILNKAAFNLDSVEIKLRKTDRHHERLLDFKASTFNLENGKVNEVAVESANLTDDKSLRHYNAKKFTFPLVKEGSIIEYSYRINSPFYSDLPAWQFQDEKYPCLWSELNIEIPSWFIFAVKTQVYDPFWINQSSFGSGVYHVEGKFDYGESYAANPIKTGVTAKTSIHRWVLKDVAPLNIPASEIFISSPKNYIDQVWFQLYQTYDGEDMKEEIIDRKTAIKDFESSFYFSYRLNEDLAWLTERSKPIVESATDPIQKAERLYNYAKQFECTDRYGAHADKSLAKTFDTKSGNGAEINMLLIAMLRANNIPADAVVLSTRSHGKLNPGYPMLNSLNDLVCKTVINGKVYFLDASDSNLPFGTIPIECYNGYALVVNADHPDSVNFDAGRIEEKKTTHVIIINDEQGRQSGSLEYVPGFYESLALRDSLSHSKKLKLFDNLRAAHQELIIENPGIDSLLKLEDPVKIHFDFIIKKGGQDNFIYFSPVLIESMPQNSFAPAERKYPVEMPFLTENTYTLNMEIPEGYEVTELPKSVRFAFNENQGTFEYLIQQNSTGIQMRSRLRLNKTIFPPEEYPSLRDFFEQIAKKQREQIVFRRK